MKQLLSKCISCCKVLGKHYEVPESPPLPLDRVKEGRPFEVTDVDFIGALYVRNSGTDDKVCICLFTCGLSRAVHLEVVCDLSIETFLRAFRRFVSRKSLPPHMMISDNASMYVSASKELEQMFTSDKLEEGLSMGVRWKCIPK